MLAHGFLRVAACAPTLRLADPRFNAERTLDLLRDADDRGADVAVFPELGLTGYTCHDLFHDLTLQRAALVALDTLAQAAEQLFAGVTVVGVPVVVDAKLFNCAAVLHRGRVLGVVPKTFLPNYKEFYDARYFAPAGDAVSTTVNLGGRVVPFGTDLLFEAADVSGFVLGVEICEDLWPPVPPSSLQALAGATVLVNLSASNETVGKATYRRQLVTAQSGRCVAAYVYAGAGPGESTTDVVFGGHCMVAENGAMLAESERFRRDAHLTVVDVDLDRLQRERVVMTTFIPASGGKAFRRVPFTLGPVGERRPELVRHVDPRPFVPADPATLAERCEEIFQTQVTGLARRLDHAGRPAVAIGVSGGLDSTLALLVLCKTLDALAVPRSTVKAFTMPGYGTGSRTRANAFALMAALGVTAREADIRQIALDEMRLIGHAPFGIALDGLTVEALSARLRDVPTERRQDLVFENVQARARTSVLMNSGFVLGTGDLSELALGWCTYNADHMSMYNPNVGVPKTLVKFLVDYAADTAFAEQARRTLKDIVATEISPELLPADASGRGQSTEETVGPYELHDFFLLHVLRFGTPPEKVLFLARHADFAGEHTPETVRKWLAVFYRRFFQNQFKRSCLPDGPKVGTVSVSPRGDWRMPSDAAAAEWLAGVERG